MKAMNLGFRFDPEWRITLFTLVMVPTMIALGFWQLERADEKRRLAEAWERQQAQPPAPVETLLDREPTALAYQQATATGRFREGEYLLLDNRIHRGRFGYEVLGIMDLERVDMAVLVNRGWVAGDPARRSLPVVTPVEGTLTVAGHVYVPPGKPYLLAEQQLAEGWPKVVQAVEISEITPAVDASRVFPHVLRLDGQSPAALTVDWRVVNVQPDKHTGYAVQWFAMAAVLAIFYFLRSSNLWQLLTAHRNGSN